MADKEREQHEAPDECDPVEQTDERGADAERAERDAEQRERERHYRHADYVHARVLPVANLLENGLRTCKKSTFACTQWLMI